MCQPLRPLQETTQHTPMMGLILLLRLAMCTAATCPQGWVAVGSRCFYRVLADEDSQLLPTSTNEGVADNESYAAANSTSIGRLPSSISECVAHCEALRPNASIACVDSPNVTTAMYTLMGDVDVWSGLIQRPGSESSRIGWDLWPRAQCISSFTPWSSGAALGARFKQPDDRTYAGSTCLPEKCAVVRMPKSSGNSNQGKWIDSPCTNLPASTNQNYGISKACVCEWPVMRATVEYMDATTQNEARPDTYSRCRRARKLTYYIPAAVAVAALVACYLVPRSGRKLRWCMGRHPLLAPSSRRLPADIHFASFELASAGGVDEADIVAQLERSRLIAQRSSWLLTCTCTVLSMLLILSSILIFVWFEDTLYRTDAMSLTVVGVIVGLSGFQATYAKPTFWLMAVYFLMNVLVAAALLWRLLGDGAWVVYMLARINDRRAFEAWSLSKGGIAIMQLLLTLSLAFGATALAPSLQLQRTTHYGYVPTRPSRELLEHLWFVVRGELLACGLILSFFLFVGVFPDTPSPSPELHYKFESILLLSVICIVSAIATNSSWRGSVRSWLLRSLSPNNKLATVAALAHLDHSAPRPADAAGMVALAKPAFRELRLQRATGAELMALPPRATAPIVARSPTISTTSGDTEPDTVLPTPSTPAPSSDTALPVPSVHAAISYAASRAPSQPTEDGRLSSSSDSLSAAAPVPGSRLPPSLTPPSLTPPSLPPPSLPPPSLPPPSLPPPPSLSASPAVLGRVDAFVSSSHSDSSPERLRCVDEI